MNRTVLSLILSSLLFAIAGHASAAPSRGDRPPKSRPAPELSVSGAGSALALIAGAALIVVGRRRKKTDAQ